MSDDYEYLVFSGGGVKCIAYCGVLDELDKRGVLYCDNKLKLKGIAGTSGGSLIASLLALDYKPVGNRSGLKGRGIFIDIEFCQKGSLFSRIVQVGIHGGGAPLTRFSSSNPPVPVNGDFNDHGSFLLAGIIGFGCGARPAS